MALSFILTAQEQALLARLARQAIESVLAGKGQTTPPTAPSPGAECLTPTLCRHLGCFVTLNRAGQLRGCIGSIVGREPLFENVWHMARAAAFEDPRFSALSLAEWGGVSLHISVLDEPTPCPDPQAVEVGRHGLILQHQGRGGVFLPQVPVEQGWNRATYLEQLCVKAGLPGGSWKAPGVQLFWYEAFVFEA